MGNIYFMKLKDYLKQEKIKTDDFAVLVGCSQPHISLICSNERRPSADLALKIEQETKGKVTVIELLYPGSEVAA